MLIKYGGAATFGKYLSKMKLKQWKQYGWADTERLQEEDKLKQEQVKEDARKREE